MSGLVKTNYKPDTYGQYQVLQAIALCGDWPPAGTTFGQETFANLKQNIDLPLYDAANNFNILSCYVTIASVVAAEEHATQACVAAHVINTLSHPDSMVFTFLENSDFNRFHQQMNEDAQAVNSSNLYTPKKRPEVPLIQPLLAAEVDKNFIETPTYQICKLFQETQNNRSLVQKKMLAQYYLRGYRDHYNTL